MMCEPCKAGGRLLVEARAAPLVGNRGFLHMTAMGRHSECDSPKTCTCQHWTTLNRGDVISDGR